MINGWLPCPHSDVGQRLIGSSGPAAGWMFFTGPRLPHGVLHRLKTRTKQLYGTISNERKFGPRCCSGLTPILRWERFSRLDIRAPLKRLTWMEF